MKVSTTGTLNFNEIQNREAPASTHLTHSEPLISNSSFVYDNVELSIDSVTESNVGLARSRHLTMVPHSSAIVKLPSLSEIMKRPLGGLYELGTLHKTAVLSSCRNVGAFLPINGSPKTQCKVAECGNKGIQRGLCLKHRYTCKENSCNRYGGYRGYCFRHAKDRSNVKACQIPGCNKFAHSRDLCYAHASECRHPNCELWGSYNGQCSNHARRDQCSRVGCRNSAVVRGLCRTHSRTPCKEFNCDKQPTVRGYCKRHSTLLCHDNYCQKKADSSRGYCKYHRLLLNNN